MAKITIVFKGGAVVDIDVDRFKVTRSSYGGFTELEWVAGKDHPLGFEPSEIAAVIERKK